MKQEGIRCGENEDEQERTLQLRVNGFGVGATLTGAFIDVAQKSRVLKTKGESPTHAWIRAMRTRRDDKVDNGVQRQASKKSGTHRQRHRQRHGRKHTQRQRNRSIESERKKSNQICVVDIALLSGPGHVSAGEKNSVAVKEERAPHYTPRDTLTSTQTRTYTGAIQHIHYACAYPAMPMLNG